ncbi:MAG: hypothetical protein ABWY06_13090 [Pseudomonas sp.]|uniref:hypothetical protein n=1 Tax=Pseudomonas sp. TaxID=306 RepID=UPI00339349AF
MPDSKQRSLLKLYQAMPTADIERRVEVGQLTPQAQVIAQQVLQARATAEVATPVVARERPAPRRKHTATIIGSLIASSLVAVGLTYLLDPQHLAITVCVALAIAATIVGKLWPRLGLVLGWGLCLTPVWLGGFLWYAGALTMKHGDFKPLEAIIAWIMLIIFSVLGWAFGATLRYGARHTGSWEQLEQELGEQHEKTREVMAKR